MFNNLGLTEKIVNQLERMGFDKPTEIQQKSIPTIFAGKDVVGRSQTGSGKTLAFGLPVIQNNIGGKEVGALIVCPTRELATQVCDQMRAVADFVGAKVTPIYGGSDITRQIKAIKTAQIVVGTPGRIMDHLRRKSLKLDKISTIILDEADVMLDMGFREDIETILKSIPQKHQMLLFSATMPNEILKLTETYQENPEIIEIGIENNAVDSIFQAYIKSAKQNKQKSLSDLLVDKMPKQAIVFCNTKSMVDELAQMLKDNKINAVTLHGDMKQGQRRSALTKFKKADGEQIILVATDVAARGIDIKDMEMVINYDLPYDLEYYIHRIGRTGRAGNAGQAISIVTTKKQLQVLHEIEKMTNSIITDITVNSNDIALEENHKRPSRNRGGKRNVSSAMTKLSDDEYAPRKSSNRFNASGSGDKKMDRFKREFKSNNSWKKNSSDKFNKSKSEGKDKFKPARKNRSEKAFEVDYDKETIGGKKDNFRSGKPFVKNKRSGDKDYRKSDGGFGERKNKRYDNEFSSKSSERGKRTSHGGERRESSKFGKRENDGKFGKENRGERRSFGTKSKFGDRERSSERKSFSSKVKFGDREKFDSKEKFGDRERNSDKRSFGGKGKFGDKEKFGKRSGINEKFGRDNKSKGNRSGLKFKGDKRK